MRSVLAAGVATCVAAAFLSGCKTKQGVCMHKHQPSVVVQPFGKTKDGKEVKMFKLYGAGGVVMEVIEHGGKVVRLFTPDRDGKMADITLGFNEVAGYEEYDKYFGSLIGRYGNRIAGGKFEIDGKSYKLPINNEPGGLPCSLHGGNPGFDAYVWQGEALADGDSVGVKLTMSSPDGDQGYPGKLDVEVKYWLTPDNVWRIEYEAVTDKPTPVNLTQHLYFNLKGEGEGTILDHELILMSDFITPVNKGLIPTGELMPVKDTPFDFTVPWKIGDRINADHEQLKFGGGYDHNWVLRKSAGALAPAAELFEYSSGRTVQVWTSEPCIQFYSGNFMTDKVPGKRNNMLTWRGGLALETQHAPNSPNQPEFPSVILRPGETYRTVTEYRFGVQR